MKSDAYRLIWSHVTSAIQSLLPSSRQNRIRHVYGFLSLQVGGPPSRHMFSNATPNGVVSLNHFGVSLVATNLLLAFCLTISNVEPLRRLASGNKLQLFQLYAAPHTTHVLSRANAIINLSTSCVLLYF